MNNRRLLVTAYYRLRPLLPRWSQIYLRRAITGLKRRGVGHVWPIDEQSAQPPAHWHGWPADKQFALVLTHDVETEVGHQRCLDLAALEKRFHFRASFNFVPERYRVSPSLRKKLTDQGFEVGVHGLKHDGNLYATREIFSRRAQRINGYLNEWGAVGFRSPSMHHNLKWIQQDLNIEYDASTFDTDPFEPQSDGVRTIFPFMISSANGSKAFVELPYTLPQDFTLFVLLGEKDVSIWKRKLDWVARQGGMALVNTHPDYMHFGDGTPKSGEYSADLYTIFLDYVRRKYEGRFFNPLPKEMAHYWRGREALRANHAGIRQ